MKTFYALVADGSSYAHANGGGFVGVNRFMDTEAESRVQAFLQLYRRLSKDHSEITALKASHQNYMLGFTAEEWEEIARQPIRLKVSEMPAAGAQIQAIQETRFTKRLLLRFQFERGILVMFDLFLKLERIGSGGYADVYRAQNIFTKEQVARKELRVLSPENRRRFERERDMLKLYGGTGSAPRFIYDDLQANPPYIIMELSTLGSLEQLVGQPVDVKRCLRWLVDVAHTLENIQRNNHKHRDLKPSNLLLYYVNGKERVKLSDFGIAQRPDTNSSLKTNSPLGTKEYLDPKAVRDNYLVVVQAGDVRARL